VDRITFFLLLLLLLLLLTPVIFAYHCVNYGSKKKKITKLLGTILNKITKITFTHL